MKLQFQFHLKVISNDKSWETSCSVLDHNTFMGSIPKDIGMLKNLIELNLSSNQLAGPIPIEIGDMEKITKMYKQEPEINLCCSQHYFSL